MDDVPTRLQDIDRLFVGPLHVGDVRLPGVVQSLDFHLLRHRLQRTVESNNYAMLTYAVQILCVCCMLTSPESNTDKGWYSTAQVLVTLCLISACFELGFFVLAYGFFPNVSSGSNSSQSQRIRSVLAIWSPPRLKQSSAAVLMVGKGKESLVRSPLLMRPEKVAEAVLLLLSIIGYLIPESDPFSKLRYAHGLRCLRLIAVLGAFDSASRHVSATLLHAVPMLATAATFFAFFLVVFGVLGVDPFKGALAYRCVVPDLNLYPNLNLSAINASNLCVDGSPYKCVDANPVTTCAPDVTSSSFFNPVVCPSPQVCRDVQSPYDGLVSFDNIANSWLVLLQITSLSSWSDILYAMWTAFPRIVSGCYCFLVIIVITFIMFNLVTAIISSSYGKSFSSAARARLGAVKRSVVAIELERFANWGFPQTLVHYLCIEVRGEDGRFDRIPFYKALPFAIVSDLLLLVVVCINAANDAKVDENYRTAVNIIEITYATIFSLEVLLSMIASGCIKQYAASKLRLYDLLCLLLVYIGFGVSVNLSVVRSMRFIRWAALVPFIRGILARLRRIIHPSVAISLVLGTYVVVFAAVCTQMFDFGNSKNSTEATRGPWDFDGQESYFVDAQVSLRTLFRFVTVGGWEEPMYNGMEQLHWTLGALYFIPVYFFFGFVLTSLYIAVIIEAFDPTEDEKLGVQRRQMEIEDLTKRRLTGRQIVAQVLDDIDFDAEIDTGDPAAIESTLALADQSAEAAMRPGSDMASAALDSAVAADEGEVKVQRFRTPMNDTSLAIFGVQNKLRRLLIRLVCEVDRSDERNHERALQWEKDSIKADHHQDKIDEMRRAANELPLPPLYGAVFGWSIMFVVALSCVQVFLDPANEACSTLDGNVSFTQQQVFFGADIAFVTIFAVEAIMKVIALGAFFGGDDRPWYLGATYFRDWWNLLDFSLLITMVVSFFVPQARPLRILRTLRPLRVIRRVRRMRHMMTGLVSALPSVFVVFALVLYFIFVCAIIGVNMFARKMNKCTNETVGGTGVITAVDCQGLGFNSVAVISPNSWRRPTSHFDHVGAGMVFMIQIASLADWSDLMRQIINVVDVGYQPQTNKHVGYSIFFVIIVVLLALIAAKLLIGLLMYHFDAHRGVLLLTDSQKDWFNIRSEIRALKPISAPPRTLFAKLQPFVTHFAFDAVINFVVFLNIMLLASSHNQQADSWTQVQYWGNIVFLTIFCMEFILKVMAFSYHYFFDVWNAFDFVVLLGSLIEFAIELASGNQGNAIVTVARTFRILRVFRSVKRITNLRSIFHTLALAFLSIVSVTALIIIVLFIFGVLGRNVFGNLRNLNNLNNNANFREIDVMFFLMLRLFTSDRWAAIMNDVQSYYPPYCNNNQPGWIVKDVDGNDVVCGTLSDCSTPASQGFFLVFYAIGPYLVMSVLVAMLLENFKFIATQTRIPITLRDLDSYQTCWMHARRSIGIELQYEYFIEPHLLSSFIIDLFNQRNTIVVNPEGLVIHPVLSAQSRLNFRKLKFELDALGRHRKLPPEQAYTFHAILTVCTRMQLGARILTIKQRTQRAYFESLCVLALTGDRLRKHLLPAVHRARQRVQERRLAAILEVEVTNSPTVHGDSDGDYPDSPHLRRTGQALRKRTSRVNFAGNRQRETPSSVGPSEASQHIKPSNPSKLSNSSPAITGEDSTAFGQLLREEGENESENATPSQTKPADDAVSNAPVKAGDDASSSPRGSMTESPMLLESRAQSTSQAELRQALGQRARTQTARVVEPVAEPLHPLPQRLRVEESFGTIESATPPLDARHVNAAGSFEADDDSPAPPITSLTRTQTQIGPSSTAPLDDDALQPVSSLSVVFTPNPHTPKLMSSPERLDRERMMELLYAYKRLEELEIEETLRRANKQRNYMERVWAATRRFIESVELQLRSEMAAQWSERNWTFRSVPRQRHTISQSPPRNPILKSGFGRRASPSGEAHRNRGEAVKTPSWNRAPTAVTPAVHPPPSTLDESPELNASGLMAPPLCPWDLGCSDYASTSHQVLYTHTCRDTFCRNYDVEHRRLFQHPSEAIVMMMP